MKSFILSGVGLALLALAGCAADPSNDPRSGGFFGGARGLASGDYDLRQQQLREERDDSLSELRSLRREGAALETERAMRADEVAAQRRQLAALQSRNQEMARRIEQLRRSKAATEQRTAEMRRKQQRLTRDIRQFEAELDRGQLSAPQADAKRLSLERQYDAIEKL
ncbi:MAG TPA: hypothetical protein PLP22_11755 [Candidatus Competibacter sp.]|nr:hypothetical protein [Candidatus Competibacter sp.]HUM94095.1 hypothetical protein [Candidatus Competibacter sp.]